jgi:hypothetical protein
VADQLLAFQEEVGNFGALFYGVALMTAIEIGNRYRAEMGRIAS